MHDTNTSPSIISFNYNSNSYLTPFCKRTTFYIYIYIYIYDHIHDHILQKDSENFEEVVKVRQMIVTKSRKEKQKSTLAYTVWLSLWLGCGSNDCSFKTRSLISSFVKFLDLRLDMTEARLVLVFSWTPL